MSRKVLFWGLLVGGLVIDQLVKAWTRGAVNPHGGFNGLPWPGVFEITYTTNKGIAFGLFQGYGVLLAPIAVAIVVLAAIYSNRNPQESKWVHAAMALLASGALGNLYDRVAHGEVTDMFWFRAINFPVFNVADMCITFAAVILILKWGWEVVPHAAAPGPETHAEPQSETPEPETVSSLVEPRESGQEV